MAHMAGITMLRHYIQYVEYTYKKCNWTILARLLSIRYEHPRIWYRPNDIVTLVRDNSDYRLHDILIAHLLCAKGLQNQEYVEAYNHQSECVAAIVGLVESQKGAVWGIATLLLYNSAHQLRKLAQKADVVAGTPQTRGRYLEQAAKILYAAYRICVTDDHLPVHESKQVLTLDIALELIKIYFRIDMIHLCEPLIAAVDTSPVHHMFCPDTKITYQYFVGRKALVDGDYSWAAIWLSYVFENVEMRFKKRLVLTYMVPANLMMPKMPDKRLLQEYKLMEFWELAMAMKSCDLANIDKVIEKHLRFFKGAGILEVIKKSRNLGLCMMLNRAAARNS